MDDRQKDYVAHTEKRYQKPFERVFSGSVPRSLAIKLKCIDCVGQEDVVNSIRECGITICPLYQFRPVIERPKSNRKGNPNLRARKTVQDTP